jgi:3-dehydrosphinganine reductase
MSGCVFVTGGSSGIGFAVARQSAARGRTVGLFARDSARLAVAADEIRRQVPGARVRTYAMDVTDAAAVEAVIGQAVADLGAPDRVVLSAGILALGEALATDLGVHRRVMEVNHFGCLAVLQALRPHLRHGSSVGLVGSAAGLAGLYGYAAYVASKFAQRGLAEVLRVELAGQGIGVTLCLPPDTETPMLRWEEGRRHPVTARMAAGARVMTADAVAAAILRGMDRGRFLVLPNWEVRVLYLLAPVLSALMRARQIAWLARPGTGRQVSGDVRE